MPGCLFDEINDLVETTERLHIDVQAGPQMEREAKLCGANGSTRRRRFSSASETTARKRALTRLRLRLRNRCYRNLQSGNSNR
jgi:hypothetical protein